MGERVHPAGWIVKTITPTVSSITNINIQDLLFRMLSLEGGTGVEDDVGTSEVIQPKII